MARRYLPDLLATRHHLPVCGDEDGGDHPAAIDHELRPHPIQLSSSCSRAGSIFACTPFAKTSSVRFAPTAKVTSQPERPAVSMEIWPMRLTCGLPTIALEIPLFW